MFWLYLARKIEDISGVRSVLEDVMAPERLKKISRMKNEDAAALSLTAGLLLHGACKEAGIEGAEQRLGYTENGRPYLLECPDYHFNISHSGDFACLVFGNRNAGVDIERIRPVKESVVRRVFTEKEQAWLSRSRKEYPADSYENDVIRLWTRKESYGKYLGDGMSERVVKTSLCPDYGADKGGAYEKAGETEVRFLEYAISGYRLSVCLSGEGASDKEAPIKLPICSSTVKINIE